MWLVCVSAEYPWQVAILKKEQFDNVYVCGGSLVDGSHILTAAHCIKSYRPEDLRIRLGEWDVNNDSGEIQKQSQGRCYIFSCCCKA